MPRLVAQAAVLLVGLLVACYPFTLGAQAEVSCRGVPMQPGDVCRKAGSDAVQTYEQRIRARHAARPVIVGVGVLVAAFGATLTVAEVRRRAQTSNTQAA